MENGEMKHTVTIENRERIVINCVDDVESLVTLKVTLPLLSLMLKQICLRAANLF